MINYNVIVSNNSNIIYNILDIITKSNNLDNINILNNSSNTIIKEYIKELLNSTKYLSYKLISARWDIDVHNNLIIQYQNAYVGSELNSVNDDGVAAGYNNGYKPNKIEQRQIKLMKMKEEQQERIEEYFELEQDFISKTKAIKEFISLLPQPEYQFIMESTYIKNMSDNQIMNECKMLYSDTYIRQARFKSIQCFCQIIRYYFMGQAKK